MRIFILTLFLLSISIATHASLLQATTGQKIFKTHSGILADDVSTAEALLRVYMEDRMECSKVRLNLNIIKPDGIFSNGLFALNLTSDCRSNISDLLLDFDPLCSRDNDGEVALLLQYKNAERLVFKRFIIKNSESCQE